MAELKTRVLDYQEREDALKSIFQVGRIALPAGVTLYLGDVDIIGIEGIEAGVPVLYAYRENDFTKKGEIKEGVTPHTIFLKSILREKRDFQENPIEITGSFNDLVKSWAGVTIAQIIDNLKPYKGKKLSTTVTSAHVVTRKGEVYPVQFNGYNLVD